MNNSDTKDSVKSIIGDLRAYAEKRIEIISYDIQNKGGRLAAALISDAIGLTLIALAVFFGFMAAGYGLGNLFESIPLGFLCLSGILLIFGFFIYKYKRNALKLYLVSKIQKFLERNLPVDADDNHSSNSSDS